jgi:uncharacterized protein YcnI
MIPILPVALVLVAAAAAHAHVIVSPDTAEAGASTTFEMRVPTEEDVPTTKISCSFPTA